MDTTAEAGPVPFADLLRYFLWLALPSVAILLAACGPVSPGSAVPAVPGYRLVRDIPLPGSTGRWDYQAFDAGSGRLYLAHLSDSEVVVFDVRTQRVVGTVRGVAEVHGVDTAPSIGRLFAAATGANSVAAIDMTSLRVVATGKGGDYPDGVAYVPDTGEVYTRDEDGHGDTILDARTLEHVGAIQLGGDIGNTKFDATTHHLFVAVGTSNELAEVDPHARAVVRRIALPGCRGAHGVQLTDSPRLGFVGCEQSGTVAVADLGSGRVVATDRAGATPDVLAYDPVTTRVYVACEDGTLTVISARDGRELARGFAGPNAHSVAVDTATQFVYLPLTDVGGRPVLRVMAS